MRGNFTSTTSPSRARRRWWAVVIVAATLLFGLAACGSADSHLSTW